LITENKSKLRKNNQQLLFKNVNELQKEGENQVKIGPLLLFNFPLIF
jgi:hypothetical protein